MSHAFFALNRATLVALAEALDAGRLAPSYARSAVASLVPSEQVASVGGALRAMGDDGMQPRHIARTLALLAEERGERQRVEDGVALVWSPPDLDHVDARDTSVVVQELFLRAERSVLIVTFALDEGNKAEALFGGLAARMDADPSLQVRICANIHRAYQDETPSAELVRQFAKRLHGAVWPGVRKPEVFYDPRSLETDGTRRAVLHAKCVVVDHRFTLLTSANFTEAAQERNIEAGLLVDDPRLAQRVVRQFERLVEVGVLRGVVESTSGVVG